MMYFENICFLILLITALGIFTWRSMRIYRNIKMGRHIKINNAIFKRFKNTLLLAFGQKKMFDKPLVGVLHLIVYLAFIIINIEVLEIVIDGIFGTHRVFAPMGKLYNQLIYIFEILAGLVIFSVVIFWVRRNILKIARFHKKEMKGFPKSDANWILYIELILMCLFLTMNAADMTLQNREVEGYIQAGSFPLSQYGSYLLTNWSTTAIIVLERLVWWLHIIGILVFLNYLIYSKHLHILLAFPNTFLANVSPKGDFGTMPSITNEIKAMLGEGLPAMTDVLSPEKFGVQDVEDLSQVHLLGAYTCTECGRCTDVCPANKTGKKLSPRKIIMDVRDRLEDKAKALNLDKKLLKGYVTDEEVWACTTCNACVEVCPVSINPMSILIEMRKYLVMEQSEVPKELNAVFANIENNGAPWPYNQTERLNWKN